LAFQFLLSTNFTLATSLGSTDLKRLKAPCYLHLVAGTDRIVDTTSSDTILFWFWTLNRRLLRLGVRPTLTITTSKGFGGGESQQQEGDSSKFHFFIPYKARTTINTTIVTRLRATAPRMIGMIREGPIFILHSI
jgi:hypothetical protein